MSAGRSRRAVLVRAIVVLVAFCAALWFLDWEAVRRALGQLSWAVLAGFIACGAVSRALAIVRWGIVCRWRFDQPVPIWMLARLALLAEFVNIWVPTFIGGDALKVWRLREHAGALEASASVVTDRILAVLGIGAAVIPVAVALAVQRGWSPWNRWVLLAIPLGASGLGFAWLAWRMVQRKWPTVRMAPRDLVVGVTLSALSIWAAMGGYLVLFSELYPLPFVEVAAIVVFSRAGRVVPIQWLGMNSVEGATWGLGVLFGVPTEVLAVAIGANLVHKYVFSLIGGGIEVAVNGTEGFVALRGMQADGSGASD